MFVKFKVGGVLAGDRGELDEGAGGAVQGSCWSARDGRDRVAMEGFANTRFLLRDLKCGKNI